MCTIGKVETLIEASIASCTPVSLKRCFIPGDPRMEKIEVMLNLWTKDKQRNKRTPSMQGNCHHARRIFQDIVSEIEVGPESKISGARDGLRNAGCTMTRYPCVISTTATEEVEEGDCMPAQIFGATKTAMLWRPLNNTFYPFEEQKPTDADMRSAKQRLTFLFVPILQETSS